MEQYRKKHPCCMALLAHVDAGKTTLSEAILYTAGVRRTLGRVDHGDAFLDHHALERSRGITIFSKQARFSTENLEVTLLDTPGHVDFSPEAERTLDILDCAVLVISASQGIQAHTLTLWRLLQQRRIPVFLFINKMDLPDTDRKALLLQLRQQLSAGCVDAQEDLAESCAMCDEALLETYLATGTVTDGNIRALVAERKVFPCCFGSALRTEGVRELMEVLDRFAPRPEYLPEFGARVFKISRDPQGNRLTWLKITGGGLQVRQSVHYVNRKGEPLEEKLQQLRLYSGEKFTAPEQLCAGAVAAVTGLQDTWAGQGLGRESAAPSPVLEPVMVWRMTLPAGVDPAVALPKLRQLEEEEPTLRLLWQAGQIHVQIMGKVQLEILRSLIRDRFAMEVNFENQRIFYKETIAAPVEGVGHFEPLRHYAEVHILLEPLERGAGLQYQTRCSADVLEAGYQSLILTHMGEKTHRGVLTGAPLTDVKMTLLAGRAHLKHTEGGDMRQATYRAIRQGLMKAQSVLLEPWYDFILTVPTDRIGRAITDIRAMSGEFDAPQAFGTCSVLKGSLPASELGDYAQTLSAYTQGTGQLQLSPAGYRQCHDTQKVLEQTNYDPEADTENTPDSVFCSHGAGFSVKWDQVESYMHLDSGRGSARPQLITANLSAGDKALEAILEKQFGSTATKLYRPPENRPAEEKLTIAPPKPQYYIVDGYNMIFAWEELASLAREDLDAARRKLCDALSSFAGFRKCRVLVVFDGYKRKGNPGERIRFHNIQVVYTRENETADAYMEALVAQIGNNYNVRVATSDAMIQLSSLRSGVLRLPARELREELLRAQEEMRRYESRG